VARRGQAPARLSRICDLDICVSKGLRRVIRNASSQQPVVARALVERRRNGRDASLAFELELRRVIDCVSYVLGSITATRHRE
jgi:hypothetical protein